MGGRNARFNDFVNEKRYVYFISKPRQCLKSLGQIENLVFVIIATGESERFVSRTPICDVTKMKHEISILQIKYLKEALVCHLLSVSEMIRWFFILLFLRLSIHKLHLFKLFIS